MQYPRLFRSKVTQKLLYRIGSAVSMCPKPVSVDRLGTIINPFSVARNNHDEYNSCLYNSLRYHRNFAKIY